MSSPLSFFWTLLYEFVELRIDSFDLSDDCVKIVCETAGGYTAMSIYCYTFNWTGAVIGLR